MMSVKCEELIDELTVQVGYGVIIQTLNIALCGTELRTDRQTDDPITRCPGGPFRPGHKNRSPDLFMTGHCIAEISQSK